MKTNILKPLTLLTAALLSACGGLDPVGKVACDGPQDCGDGYACIAHECTLGDVALSDTDGDGLTDGQELDGWEVVVDERGYGLVVDAEFLTRRQVTSSPTNPDTDGDGLDDRVEFGDKSDPSKADTDGDGLDDGEEKLRWKSNVLSVDSDGDAQDPDSDTLPISDLFDGAEIAAGTSPTLEDTDGDGKNDREERDVSNRDPRIAEIPQADLRTEGGLTVQMNVTYSDATTEEVTYGEEYSSTNASRTSRTDMESTAITMAASSGGEGYFDDLEFSKEGALKFFGGKALELGRSLLCQSTDPGRVEFDSSNPMIIEEALSFIGGLASEIFNASGIADVTPICDAPTPETTNTTGFEITRESSQSATQSYYEYRTNSQTRTETASNGIVTVGFRIRNIGISTFDLTNPSVTMMQWAPNPQPSSAFGGGAFRTLATLRPIDGGQLDANGNRVFTLSPNSDVVIQMENREVNADFIKDFLARPEAIFFSPAQFALNDKDGVNFEYLTEETYNRTATLVIDDGVSDIVRYQIATNVDRTDEGALAGVSMKTALKDILEIPYETKVVPRQDADGNTVDVAELESIGSLANQRSANRGDPENGVAGDSEGVWVIYTKRAEQAEAALPFEDIRIKAGDEIRLVYIRDIDGDGLMAREEAVYGSDDNDNDSDLDGLSDFQEAKVGWDVTVTYNDGADSVTYRVASDPVRSDRDGDGLSDLEERTLGTDPNNPDTDDDGIGDRCEGSPLDTNDTVDNLVCRPQAVAVYISQSSGIAQFDAASDGSLTPMSAPTVFPAQGNTEEMVLTPDLSHAYVAVGRNGTSAVNVFDIDSATNALTVSPYPSATQSSGLHNRPSIAIDPDGNWIYSPDDAADSDRFYVYEINKDTQPGSLSQIQSTTYVSGSDKVVMDPMGRFAYVLGANREIGIFGINRDPDHATIPVGGLISLDKFDPGYFPREIALGPYGEYLYAIDGNGGFEVFEIDNSSGALVPVAGTFTTGADAQEIIVDAFGRYVFTVGGTSVYVHRIERGMGGIVTNIDQDTNPNDFTGFTIAGANNAAVEPTGQRLFVVGSGIHTLTINDGLLSEDVTPVDGVSGNHITVLSRLP